MNTSFDFDQMSHILTYLSHILTYFLLECAFLCVLVRWFVLLNLDLCRSLDTSIPFRFTRSGGLMSQLRKS